MKDDDLVSKQSVRGKSISSIDIMERYFTQTDRNFSESNPIPPVFPAKSRKIAPVPPPLFQYCCICTQLIYSDDFNNREVCERKYGLYYHKKCFDLSSKQIRHSIGSRASMYLIENSSDADLSSHSIDADKLLKVSSEKRRFIVRCPSSSFCAAAMIVSAVIVAMALLLSQMMAVFDNYAES